jgi:uncharacterized protein YbjT (DUF2867 family)
MDPQRQSIFVSGGTGYLGRSMIAGLLGRGHTVRALVRPGSEGKLPAGCEAVLGDAPSLLAASKDMSVRQTHLSNW